MLLSGRDDGPDRQVADDKPRSSPDRLADHPGDGDLHPQPYPHRQADRDFAPAHPVFNADGYSHRVHDLDAFTHLLPHRHPPSAAVGHATAHFYAAPAAFRDADPGASHRYPYAWAAGYDSTLPDANALKCVRKR